VLGQKSVNTGSGEGVETEAMAEKYSKSEGLHLERGNAVGERGGGAMELLSR